MANIKIYKDKTVYPSQYDIINKFENKADKLTFDFSDIEMQGNKYLVFEDNGKAKVPILMIDNAIEITNFISSKPGPHRALVIVSGVELDETLNISDQNIKFISNEFEIVVNDNFITNEAAQEWELPNYLKIPFDELLALIEKVKNDLEIGAFTGNGIESIDKISSVKNTDTYRITFTNKETFDYTITNGIDGQTPVITIKNGYWHVNNVNTGQKAQGEKGDKGIGIRSIVKTSTNENIDTYTITFDNDTTSDFTVTNGVNGKDGKSSYEIAVEHGFEGTEEEWLESLEYQHSEEFAQLAEQIREDANTASSASQSAAQSKKSVDETVAQFSSDYTAKVNAFDNSVQTANTNFDNKVTQANSDLDAKVQEAKKQAEKATEEANRATQATDGKLDKNLGAESANKLLGTDEAGNIVVKEEIKQTAANVSYGDNSNVEVALDDINKKLGDLMYTPISITSFTNNKNNVEMGSTITDVTLNWNYNKTPKTLSLDGSTLDVSLKTKTLTGQSIKANKTFTLKATDERDAVSTKTTAITFLNGVYYGIGDDLQISGITNQFILGLTKTLQSSRAKTFTVNAGVGKHIYYIIPTRYGTPVFKVGGFEGGFEKLGTVNFTNASGYAENYDVYKSGNANLGNTTVVVS